MSQIITLYSKIETDFTHNGLMILQPIEAIVTEEINGDYSLKLTVPRFFSEIENEQIIKVPTPKRDQLFRIYNSDVDMLGNPVFYARHIFYDLLVRDRTGRVAARSPRRQCRARVLQKQLAFSRGQSLLRCDLCDEVH